MKYLKTYEIIKSRDRGWGFKKDNNVPEVGDYVVCKANDRMLKKSQNYIENNIGQIINISNNQYSIQYDNPPIDRFDYDFYDTIIDGKNVKYQWFQLYQILYCSDNKEELELFMATKKYNI